MNNLTIVIDTKNKCYCQNKCIKQGYNPNLQHNVCCGADAEDCLYWEKNINDEIVELGDFVDVYGGIKCIVVKVKGEKPFRVINAKIFEEVYSYENMQTLRNNCYLIEKRI